MEKEVKEEIKKAIAEALAGNVAGKGEVVIREGQALPLHEPERVQIHGTIDAPARWIEKREATINQKECYVEVNREEMTITLVTDEKNYYGGKCTG